MNHKIFSPASLLPQWAFLFIYNMVLFIENKKSFEEDLGDKSSKEIHKQIYSNLRYYLNTKNGVPSKLFGQRGREIHFFILRRCNIDDNFFVYSYGGYDMEVN